MSVVRVLFMGTPKFAEFHLKSLIEDEHYKVVGVVSQPDRKQGRKMRLTPSPVKALAVSHNIPVVTPEKFNNEETYSQISQWKPEVVVVVAYGQIISSKFLKMFFEKVVNVHGSLLPRWRGAAPIQRAIEAGDTETGVCLQVMVKKLDAGAVLGERKINLNSETSALELHDQLMPLGADLLHIELMDYVRGNLTPIVQDENKVTYAHKLDKAESLLDWNQSSDKIHNKVRGFTLGPGCFTWYADKKIKIHQTKIVTKEDLVTGDSEWVDNDRPPGQIILVNKGEIIVQCGGKTYLRLLVVQPESKPRLQVSEFLKGYKVNRGDKFGK